MKKSEKNKRDLGVGYANIREDVPRLLEKIAREVSWKLDEKYNRDTLDSLQKVRGKLVELLAFLQDMPPEAVDEICVEARDIL